MTFSKCKINCQDIPSTRRDSNHMLAQFKSAVLPIHRPVGWILQTAEDNAAGNDLSHSHTPMGVIWSLQFRHKLYTKIQERTNKCTILKQKDVIIKTLGLRHVSTLSCG